MNREIKIRGWDLEDNDWVYGVLNPRQLNFEFKHKFSGNIYTGYGMDLIDEKSVGLYTGIKDRNGVEIYEGDIVLYEDDLIKGKCKVVYEDGGFILKMGIIAIPLSVSFEIEVIGNIYENKDLLEGQKWKQKIKEN